MNPLGSAGPDICEPRLVLVPIQQADPEANETGVLMRQMSDGRLALPVFSDLDTLVAACGERQPWMLLPVERLAGLQGELGFDGVILDVPLIPEQRAQGGPDGGR